MQVLAITIHTVRVGIKLQRVRWYYLVLISVYIQTYVPLQTYV